MHATVTSDTVSATKTRLAPTRVARDTFVIHDHVGEGTSPMVVAMNSLVIRSAEPVVVDTGTAENRERFFADLASVVDPADIRWVFLSHDDVDHTGNVNELMASAPHATLVASWFLQERMGSTLEVPPTRQRWLDDGEKLDVGDRKLLAVRPPAYDSPTTRGVYDTSTGVYWGADAFGIPMPHPVPDAADLPAEVLDIGMSTFTRYVAPWIEMADPVKYDAAVDRVATLNPEVIVGCHHPVLRGPQVDRAIEITRRAATATILPPPDQAVLDELQRQFVSG